MLSRILLLILLAIPAFAEPREPGPHPPSQALKNPIEMSEASIRAGLQVWRRDCAVCHGMDGRGETEMLEFLNTPPTDFTRGEFRFGKTDGEIFSVIRDGTNTEMTPFGDKIPEQRMWHVVNFVKSLIKIDEEPEAEAPVEEEVLENPIEMSDASVRKGLQIWRRDCSVCHAMNGNGETEMLEFLGTPPTDFTKAEFRYGETDGHIFKIIRDGTPNDMTPFGEKLKPDQIWHLVNFIRSLVPEEENQDS